MRIEAGPPEESGGVPDGSTAPDSSVVGPSPVSVTGDVAQAASSFPNDISCFRHTIESLRRRPVGAAGRNRMATTVYTAIIEKEQDVYAALCPELDVASQGATVEEATTNLREAIELFLECADPQEIKRRLKTEIFVTRIEAKHG